MSYTVLLHPKAARFLQSLPEHDAARIRERLRQASEEPWRFLERLHGADYLKLRIGRYRALIDLDQGERVLLVQVLDKRSRIYKR